MYRIARQSGSNSRVSGSKAKPEGSWFCESFRLEKDLSIGRKVGGRGARCGSNRGGGRVRKKCTRGWRKEGREGLNSVVGIGYLPKFPEVIWN